MTYVLVLLWVCALALLVLVPLLIHELTTPTNPDLAVLERHRDARTALRRANTRPSTSVPVSAWSYGPADLVGGGAPHGAGADPFEQRDAHDASARRSFASGRGQEHAVATTPTRSSPERRVGLLDPRNT